MKRKDFFEWLEKDARKKQIQAAAMHSIHSKTDKRLDPYRDDYRQLKEGNEDDFKGFLEWLPDKIHPKTTFITPNRKVVFKELYAFDEEMESEEDEINFDFKV